jgi:uncharacterized protein YceK
MTRAFLVTLALLVSGCATTATQTVVVDTFCGSPASKKRVWNPETDTIEHIREAITFNTYVDRRCGSPGKA